MCFELMWRHEMLADLADLTATGSSTLFAATIVVAAEFMNWSLQ